MDRGRGSYAVIEDKKATGQNLYRVGDRVQDALIKMILREGVVLDVGGQGRDSADRGDGCRLRWRQDDDCGRTGRIACPYQSLSNAHNLATQVRRGGRVEDIQYKIE